MIRAAAGMGLSLSALMRLAVEREASDIHLVPGRPPMLRVHGELTPLAGEPTLKPEDTLAFARTVENGNRWKLFEDTREADICVSEPGLGRFRVNLHWQRGTVAVALRAIPYEAPPWEALHLPEVLKHFAMRDQGLMLVTGPTGSGKTTTLAAMINYINENRSCHIVTIEDPIEYLHPHKKSLVTQREMHEDTRSFPEALRRVLRQDPNVILIGEMRDLETIQTAMTLAETGHLVLATLHTGDATQALTRIIDVYPAYQQTQARMQLSLVLLGVLAQQLIRRRDGTGRALAYECLVATPSVRNLIRSESEQQIYSALQTGGADGMVTLNKSLFELCRQGVIFREEAMRKSTRPKELTEMLLALGA